MVLPAGNRRVISSRINVRFVLCSCDCPIQNPWGEDVTRTILILLAAGGSAALLAGAFAFQYIGGLAPCPLCLLQRWPHAAAVLIGALAILVNRGLLAWLLPALGGVAAAVTGGYGVYHTGVERGWWPGPDTCVAGPVGGISAEDLLTQIMEAPLLRCDEVAWQMVGLSMASWNAVLSFALVLLWGIAAARSRRT
jgi:disulfide bond formation protein DsbB